MSHTDQEIKYIFSILAFLKMSHYTKMISVIWTVRSVLIFALHYANVVQRSFCNQIQKAKKTVLFVSLLLAYQVDMP